MDPAIASHYAALGLTPGATTTEIIDAFQRKVTPKMADVNGQQKLVHAVTADEHSSLLAACTALMLHVSIQQQQ